MAKPADVSLHLDEMDSLAWASSYKAGWPDYEQCIAKIESRFAGKYSLQRFMFNMDIGLQNQVPLRFQKITRYLFHIRIGSKMKCQ